jgi:hypothetical protein
MKPRLCLLLALAALPLAGCGSSGSSGSGGSGADPAKLVPAGAPIYLEAVVRPDGSVRDGANDALKKLLHTDDPGAKITGLLDKAAASDGVSWEDLKPWLGQRFGVFLTSLAQGKVQGALIADTTDTGKAQATLDKIAAGNASRHHTTVAKQTYKGVDLKVNTGSNQASGIVDDYAVVGSVAGVHQAIDVARGGRPLTDVADYTSARSAVKADDGLGLAYVVPQGLIDTIAGMSGSSSSTASPFSNPQALAVLRQVLARGGRAAAASLHADGSAVRIDAATIGAPGGSGSTTAATGALAALPAEAWLGIGFGDLGGTLSRGLAQISQLASLSSTGLDMGSLLTRFKAKTGIDLQRDFFSWMGDGALFVEGTGLADIGGALSIKSTDPAKSHRAVGILGRALQKTGLQARPATIPGYDTAIELRSARVPISLFVAAGGDRFSLGVNPKALTDALHPANTLGSTPAYSNATKALGGDLKPVFLLDTPTIINFVEGLGLGNRPGFAQVKPYLDVLGPMTAGSAYDGNIRRVAFALALR